jgi:hypothetical protein
MDEVVSIGPVNRRLRIGKRTLKALRALKQQDPDFEDSIKAFANAESQLAGSDRAEGVSFTAGTVHTTPAGNERRKT